MSKTLSTLHYANRARNIRNAPSQNIDATADELRRLRSLTHVLKCELIKQRFNCKLSSTNAEGVWDNGSAHSRLDISDLLQRGDVIEYIKQIEEKASEKGYTYDRTLPQSVINTPHLLCLTSAKVSSNDKNNDDDNEGSNYSDVGEGPERGMQIIDNAIADDQQDEQIIKIEGDIEEQEICLVQLKEQICQRHDIQEQYIILINEVQNLRNLIFKRRLDEDAA